MMNRGRIEIMAQVLVFCEQPRLKTQIMYTANISFNQFATYETLLLSRRLLAREGGKYHTTQKGTRFVQAFSQLQNTLEGASSDIIPAGASSQIGQNGLTALRAGRNGTYILRQ